MSGGGVSASWTGVSPQGRLVIGFVATIGLLAGVAALGWAMLLEDRRSVEGLYEQDFVVVLNLASLRSNLNAESLAVAMMLNGPPEEWAAWQSELRTRAAADGEIVRRLRQRAGDDAALVAQLDSLEALRRQYLSDRAGGVLPLLESGRLDEARERFGEMRAWHDQIRALVRRLAASQTTEAARSVDRARKRLRFYAIVYLVAVTGAVTSAGILSFMTYRMVAGHLAMRRQTERELKRVNRALRTISVCNRALVRATTEQGLYDAVCHAVVTECGYRMAWVGRAEPDREKSVIPVAQAGFEQGYLEKAHITWADTGRGRGPTGTAIRTGRPATCRNMHTAPEFAPWREDALRRGYASSIVLPLRSGGETFGALSIYATEPDAFDEEERRLLQALTDDLVFGVVVLRAREDRRRFKRALHSASTYNRKLIEASLDPLVAIGPDGKITDVNAATEAVTGRSRTELVGTDFADCFTDPDTARAGYKRVFREGAVRNFPLELRHRDGRTTPVLYNASVYRDDRGNVAGVFAAARDVTERRRNEEEIRRLNSDLERRVALRTAELAASERRFHGIYDTAPVSIWQEDWSAVFAAVAALRRDGVADFPRYFAEHPEFVRRALEAIRIEDVNGFTLEMFGAGDKADVLTSLATKFGSPETLAGFVGALAALAAGEQVYRTEISLNRVDGGVIHGLMAMAFPVRDSGDGQVLVSVTDITARKTAERNLRRARERAELLAESASRLLAHTDPRETVEDICRRVLGLLDCQVFVNYVLDRASGRLRLNACAGIRPEDKAGIEWLDAGSSICGNVAAGGQPIVIEDLRGDADPRADLLRAHDIQAYACHPLLVQDKVIGTLSFGTCSRRRFGDDELETMQAVTNLVAMALNRVETEAALHRADEQYRRLFATTLQGVVYQDVTGEIISMNPAAERILGKTRAEFLGSSSVGEEHDTIRTDGSPFPGLEHPAMVALRTGRQVTNVVMGVYNPVRKEHRWINVDAVPLFRPGRAEPYQVYTAFEDITERKRSEDRVRRLNEELQLRAGQLAASNRELEAFAYSVSHDLRAPLRSIDGYGRILLEEYRDRLDDDGRDALERVGRATRRMNRLIDDLLTLSRVARTEMRLQTVSLDRLARAVLRDLQQAEPDRGVTCTIADELTVRADRNLMRVVLENLLGNAWKFTARQPAARIEFGVTEMTGRRVFFVRDNGAGFDMTHAGRLFGAFQRLHSADEYPGTGIGLATVQRILLRHGGRIWAEGVVGKGATFYFNLPEPGRPGRP